MAQRPHSSLRGTGRPASFSRQELIALLIVFVIAIGYAVWHNLRTAPGNIDLGSDITTERKMISVQVEGAVVKPGMVTVREGSLATVAIMAAGGFLPTADQEAVNLKQPIIDGSKIYVPYLKSVQESTGGQTSAVDQSGLPAGDSPPASKSGLININTASPAELGRLPGIGEGLASRIIEYRVAHGPFQKIEDIMQVTGIGDAKFQRIRRLITVGG